MSPEPRQQSGGGLSLKTLAIAGAASATAAFLVPMIWEPGTVFAAAMTPIIVTVMTELLRRPADTVSAVAKRTTATPSLKPRRVEPVQEPHEEFDPLAPPPPEDVAHLRTFVCAVVFVTGSQLLAGKSIGGDNGNSTTFFNGSSRRDRDRDGEQQTPTPTKTPEKDATRTPTPTPSATPTPTQTPTVTPAPSVAPQSASPVPSPTLAP